MSLNQLVAFVNTGNIKEALELIEPMIEKFPSEALLFNIRGVCNKDTPESSRIAVDDFNEAITSKC